MTKPLTPGEQLHKAFKLLEPYTLHAGEVLVQWIEDGSEGQVALIRFNEEKHPLKDLMFNGDGKMQTRIVHAIIIEKDDAGEPINQQRRYQLRNATLKGGKMCQKFHILKAEHDFHRFLYAERKMTALADMTDRKERAEHVETFLRETLLKGQSSKMLDHNEELKNKFLDFYWRPYRRWLNERESNIS